jgi:hypothetical protein
LDVTTEHPAVSSRLPAIAIELSLTTAIEAALYWLSTSNLGDTAAYIRKTQSRFSEITKTLGRLGRQQ